VKRLALVLLGLLAAPAHGATVRATREVVLVQAARGEANRVTVAADGRVRDAGAPLRARRGCLPLGRHAAWCPRRRVAVLLRDGDDRAAVRADVRTILLGGPGADVLVGSARFDRIAGGPGADVVRAGGGRDLVTGGRAADAIDGGPDRDLLIGQRGPDVLRGGAGADGLVGGPGADDLRGGGGRDVFAGNAGADRLRGGSDDDRVFGGSGADALRDGSGADRLGGGPGDDRLRSDDGASAAFADRLDGGPGRDLASYASRSAPVQARLGGPGGVTGERDRLERLEDLAGGSGDDVLRGDDGPNLLTGGGGADRYDAGGGDDVVDAGRRTGDVTCGAGADAVLGTTPRVLLRPDCEHVRTGSPYDVGAQATVAPDGTVRVEQLCATAPGAGDVRLVLPPAGAPWRAPAGEPGTVLAGGPAPAGPLDAACPATLALTEAGRALVAAGTPTPVTVDGGPSWSLVLAG
jgi:hypothetical protein